MARLFADENFPLPVVSALRSFGHDVVTAWEAGSANQGVSDAEILDIATSQDRAVLTLDRIDFKKLHGQRSSTHSGIVACTADDDFAGQAQRIDQVLTKHESLKGQLIRIYRG